MATPEAKIQDSPADSSVVASDSEFLTPVSSPTDLLTPDPSPEQQRQETKEPQPETPPSPTKESKKEVEASDKIKTVQTPVKKEKQAEEPPKESDTTLEITPEKKKSEESVKPKVNKAKTEKPEGSLQAEIPAVAKPVEENKAEKVVTSESGDHARGAERPEKPAELKVQETPKEAAKVQDPPKETAKVQDPPKESAKAQDPPKESAKAQDPPKKPAKEDPKLPPETPEVPPVAKVVEKEKKTVESPPSPPVAEKPTPKRKSPPPPIEPEIQVRKISPVLADIPTAKLVAVQSATEKEQPTKGQSADPPATNVPSETVSSKQQGQEANKEEAQPVKETVTSPSEASKSTEGSGELSQEQPKQGGASGDSDDKSKSVETEKSQGSVHDLQDALLTGKPGYWGGKAGLGEHTTGYESEDSLLTAGDRRSSLTTGGGGGAGQGWMGFTRRQVLTLLVFSVADFFSAIIISLQGPFYPREVNFC